MDVGWEVDRSISSLEMVPAMKSSNSNFLQKYLFENNISNSKKIINLHFNISIKGSCSIKFQFREETDYHF
jgi:hypothetical protein